MRSRIPTDDEVKEDKGPPTATHKDPRVVAELRESLSTFQVHVEGPDGEKKMARCGSQSGEGWWEEEEEDEYGPVILLHSFWRALDETAQRLRLEGFFKDPIPAWMQHLKGLSAVNTPVDADGDGEISLDEIKASGSFVSWQTVATAQNSAVVAAAMEWPHSCGADRVRGLPPVRPLPDPEAISAAANKEFGSETFRRRFQNLLQLVADGHLSDGLVVVSSFLSLVLPMVTTARVLTALQRDVMYLQGYWGPPAESAALRRDGLAFERIVAERHPDLVGVLESADVSLALLATQWLASLFFHLLPSKGRFALFDAFLEDGVLFLMRFGLALLESRMPLLIKAQNEAAVREVLERAEDDTCDGGVSLVRRARVYAPGMALDDEELEQCRLWGDVAGADAAQVVDS